MCHAGDNYITLAPNGSLYACPAFYFGDPVQSLGNLQNGVAPYDRNIFNGSKQIGCSDCNAKFCKRCSWLNRKYSEAENICTRQQCEIFS